MSVCHCEHLTCLHLHLAQSTAVPEDSLGADSITIDSACFLTILIQNQGQLSLLSLFIQVIECDRFEELTFVLLLLSNIDFFLNVSPNYGSMHV